MRCVYQPETEAFWLSQYMKGGGMEAFSGIPYQRGTGIGSIFKSLIRFILPFAKKMAPSVASEVMAMGGDIARNISAGKDWKKPAKKRVRKVAGQLLESGGKQMQEGAGKSIKRIKNPTFYGTLL